MNTIIVLKNIQVPVGVEVNTRFPNQTKIKKGYFVQCGPENFLFYESSKTHCVQVFPNSVHSGIEIWLI